MNLKITQKIISPMKCLKRTKQTLLDCISAFLSFSSSLTNEIICEAKIKNIQEK